MKKKEKREYKYKDKLPVFVHCFYCRMENKPSLVLFDLACPIWYASSFVGSASNGMKILPVVRQIKERAYLCEKHFLEVAITQMAVADRRRKKKVKITERFV